VLLWGTLADFNFIDLFPSALCLIFESVGALRSFAGVLIATDAAFLLSAPDSFAGAYFEPCFATTVLIWLDSEALSVIFGSAFCPSDGAGSPLGFSFGFGAD